MAGLSRVRRRRLVPLGGGSWRVVSRVGAADQIPETLPERGVSIVGTVKRPTWIAFDCPCHTGHRIMLNLDPARRPLWRVVRLKPLTLSPSVDALRRERRCHFFLRSGAVFWVPDDWGELYDRQE